MTGRFPSQMASNVFPCHDVTTYPDVAEGQGVPALVTVLSVVLYFTGVVPWHGSLGNGSIKLYVYLLPH